MKRMWVVSVVAMLLVCALGCTGPRHQKAALEYPAAFDCNSADSVVVWSSEQDSIIRFYARGKVVGETKVRVFSLSSLGPVPRDDKGRLSIVSSGELGDALVDSIRIDPTTCAVLTAPAGSSYVAWTANGKFLYTATSIDPAGHLNAFNEQGDEVLHRRFENAQPATVFSCTALEFFDNRLLVGGTVSRDRDNGLEIRVLELEVGTWKLLATHVLPEGTPVVKDIVIDHGKAYLIGERNQQQQPTTGITVLDLASGASSVAPVPEPLPLYAHHYRDGMIIANTSWVDLDDLVRLKKVTHFPFDGKPPTVHSLKYGYMHTEVDRDSLLALGIVDRDHFQLTRYRLPDFSVESDEPLTIPGGARAKYYTPTIVAPLRKKHP